MRTSGWYSTKHALATKGDSMNFRKNSCIFLPHIAQENVFVTERRIITDLVVHGIFI